MCGQTPKNQEFSQCQQACVEANIDLDLAGKLDSGDWYVIVNLPIFKSILLCKPKFVCLFS